VHLDLTTTDEDRAEEFERREGNEFCEVRPKDTLVG
jgi:hypothetical protein